MQNHMTPTTLLFFPNYLGGGFGHIGRCLALAETWQKFGGRAVFALGGPHASRVAEAGFEVHPLHAPRYTPRHNTGLAYVHVTDVAYQVARDGFDHPRVVREALKAALDIIERVQPDALVGDGYILTRLIGMAAGLPVVQITKSVAHPHAREQLWTEPAAADVRPPDVLPIFRPVLKSLGAPPLQRAIELLDGDLLLLPGILPLDPMRSLPPRTYYVGPMVRRIPGRIAPPPWLAALEEKGEPIVYITVGGASGIAGDPTFRHLVIAALGEQPYQVVFSTGGQDPAADITLPGNIHVIPWIAPQTILPRARAVVFHGGYTRMEVLLHGLPSVVIPFHSEQEYYGRLMQRAGASILLPYSTAPYQKMNILWRGGRPWKRSSYTLQVRTHPTLSPQTLREAVDAALHHPSLRASAQALQQALQAMHGAEQAARRIQRHIKQDRPRAAAPSLALGNSLPQ